MRCGGVAVAGQVGRTPGEQRGGTGPVSPGRVGQAHRQLRQPPPQVPLGGRRGLPGVLQHLVRLERPAGVEQPLGLLQRLGGAAGRRWRPRGTSRLP